MTTVVEVSKAAALLNNAKSGRTVEILRGDMSIVGQRWGLQAVSEWLRVVPLGGKRMQDGQKNV